MGDRAEFDDAKLRGSLELVERVMAQRGPFDGIVGSPARVRVLCVHVNACTWARARAFTCAHVQQPHILRAPQVGFSQGAILASVLVMLQHRGRLLQVRRVLALRVPYKLLQALAGTLAVLRAHARTV